MGTTGPCAEEVVFPATPIILSSPHFEKEILMVGDVTY
jgi:hypothetical protein